MRDPLFGARVERMDLAVEGHDHDGAAIGIEPDVGLGVGPSDADGSEQCPAPAIPQADAPVDATGRDKIAIRGVADRHHVAVVALDDRTGERAGGNIDDGDLTVASGGRNESAVG
jgi:hypothetical protein